MFQSFAVFEAILVPMFPCTYLVIRLSLPAASGQMKTGGFTLFANGAGSAGITGNQKLSIAMTGIQA